MAFLGCELAALLWLLWRAEQGWRAGETAPLWWAVLAAAATLSGARAWRAAWLAAACRLVRIAPGGSATEIVVALPEGAEARARVMACWQLGSVAAVLCLAPAQAAQADVPRVLLIGSAGVPDGRDEAADASRRALLRALHGAPGSL